MKIAAMSTALVLLCVIVVAQTENATKSVTSHRLTVSPNPVELEAGKSATVTITPSMGYYHPIISYGNQTYEVGQPFEGEIFTVESAGTNNPYCFVIKAKDVVGKKTSESIYIDVEEIPLDQRNKNMARSGGVTLTISIISETNQ